MSTAIRAGEYDVTTTRGTALTVEQIGRIVHDANRAVQVVTGDPHPSPPWDDAEEWMREATFNTISSVRAGVSLSDLHAEWCEHKYADGWTYGPVKDPRLKTHPALVQYDDLPPEQHLVVMYTMIRTLLDHGWL